jgi:acetyl esterase/lipase
MSGETRYGCCDAAEPKVVFVHGGGFSAGRPSFNSDIASNIHFRVGFDVLMPSFTKTSVGMASKDIIDYINKNVSEETQLILMGGSSGAYIAALVAQELYRRDDKRLCGLVMICPAVPHEREDYLKKAAVGEIHPNFPKDVIKTGATDFYLSEKDASNLLKRQTACVFDIQLDMSDWQIPTLMICGGRDGNTPLFTLLSLMMCPMVTTKIFGGEHHILQRYCNEETLDEIELFCNGIVLEK